ncbi:DUF1993 domain-containing protein [Alsobacter sp. SYSU M60028]|uniref:DUF1993 domain-containing protein n=1 Tax=Alsobacter ponti TaxID=2962936 RepID=A0ABT1LHP8_9HYPH|nr:DUF1993 domain-containing protein [Alsobacter ponti]MCP8941024.1 DUF1993 domain-containing protein [Alsobacter ponti]
MSLSMYQASVPVFLRGLDNLSAIVAKAAEHAAARKVDPAVLLGCRLYPDMFPLSRQIQLVTDFAKGTTARLAGIEPPKYEDVETTVEQLQARIAKTRDFVAGFSAAQVDGSEDREVTLTIGGQPRVYKGQDYLLNFALPNFYFHAATAYGILRHNGVELGKRDFVGRS